MSKNDTFEQKLAWASAVLRRPASLDEWGAHAALVFKAFFPDDTFYHLHFFDGADVYAPANANTHVPQAVLDGVRDLYRNKRPWEPAHIIERNRYVVHAAELIQWYTGMDLSFVEARRTLFEKEKIDWMIGMHVFDGEVEVGGCGIYRPFSREDYTAADWEVFYALYPHVADGLRAAAARTRVQMFGDAIAAALEYHPSALFVVNQQHALVYANHAAKLLMQTDEPGHSNLPMAPRSPTFQAIQKCLAGVSAAIPGVSSHEVVTLPSLPRLNLENARLVIANPARKGGSQISDHQRKVLYTVAASSIDDAAAALGISVATTRTHLRNIYARLNVENLAEAVLVAALEP